MSLVDSLAQLDPNNDEHWTTSGDPLLNVVKDIHGSAVTRAQINEAAPGFNRSNFDLVVKGEAVETETAETVSTQAEPTETVVEADAEVTNVEGQQEGTDEAKDEETSEDPLKPLEAKAAELRSLISKSKNELNNVIAEMDVIIRQREQTVNGATQSELIKRFQAQQAKQREAAFKG